MIRLGMWGPVLGLLLFALIPALLVGGCETGAKCAGGYINAQGECEAQCVASKCKLNNRCVGNRCILPCTGHEDCASGESCTLGRDDSGDSVPLCQPTHRRPPFVDPLSGLQPTGYGWPCALGEFECAPVPPNPPGATACPNGLECDIFACADCQPDAAACGGDPLCNLGRCGNGAACTFNTCPIEQCTPFSCITAGEGDANAYCSRHDCQSNAECPDGFYCGNTRDARDICGNTCSGGFCSNDADQSCTTDSNCQKGNNSTCGIAPGPCADLAALQATGASFFEGSACLMRRSCLVRDSCAPCDDNFDCSRGNAQVCGTHAGDNVCLRLCNTTSDCLGDEVCVPYVPASGGTGNTCSINANIDCQTPEDCPAPGESCNPRQVCVPTSGACDASDTTTKFCRHCVDDTNCGDADKFGRWACVDIGSGEKVCRDLAFTLVCAIDENCPLSAGGKHGECLDEDDPIGLTPEDDLYHHCYLPYDAVSGNYTCH